MRSDCVQYVQSVSIRRQTDGGLASLHTSCLHARFGWAMQSLVHPFSCICGIVRQDQLCSCSPHAKQGFKDCIFLIQPSIQSCSLQHGILTCTNTRGHETQHGPGPRHQEYEDERRHAMLLVCAHRISGEQTLLVIQRLAVSTSGMRMTISLAYRPAGFALSLHHHMPRGFVLIDSCTYSCASSRSRSCSCASSHSPETW